MDETALRALVRDVVARQLALSDVTAPPDPARAWSRHTSHVRFDLAPTSDGTCIVEPAARCTHCGYCQSMGH